AMAVVRRRFVCVGSAWEGWGHVNGLSPLNKGGLEGGDTMTRVYNRTSEKSKRQLLRRDTPKAEEVLWSKLRRCQMLGYKFRRQYRIEAYVVDFCCPTTRNGD